ncbi:MAG: hypothetical protein OXC30_00930, partial [Alphaproteobacteria bacterium]|nr:hypothetical protein [Alphaproteobacteria bacterium]
GAFVPEWGQPMQSGVMMPPGCVCQDPPQHQYPPQFQPPHPNPMHGAFVPEWGQPMQSGVMMPPGCVCQDPPQHQYPPQFQHPHPNPNPMHGAFVPQCFSPMQSRVMMPPRCVYQNPPQHQYPPQFQHPHPNPMHDAFVPQWGQPMQSGVMMPPGCAPQLRNADLEQYLEHLRAYVYRGDKPRLDSGEPDYVAYAYAGKKVEIEEELPNMLDRIAYTVKNKPGDEVRSCEHNVRARLLYIKNSLVWMNNLEKAMIFAWAFVMERKADEAFYALGFLQDDLHDIHYLWISWRLELPNYLYALMECTNIKGYGEEMRSSETCLRHQKAQDERCSEIPTEDLQSYISKWEQIMDMRNYRNQGMRSLFNRIFPKGDAPDAIVLKKFL